MTLQEIQDKLGQIDYALYRIECDVTDYANDKEYQKLLAEREEVQKIEDELLGK